MALPENTEEFEARRWPQLGSLEHILYFARLSKSLKPKSVDELYGILSEYNVAESWAYFIAQNETPKRGGAQHNVSLDTRELHGYRRGPIIDAEYNYDPLRDNNYVYVYGRPSAKTRTTSYHLRMHLRDDLELNTDRSSKPLEAHYYRGRPQNKSYRYKVFRTNASAEYRENRPKVFLEVLQIAAAGLANFVDARDNF